MFQNANFYLIDNASSNYFGQRCFDFVQEAQITPRLQDKTNIKACRSLVDRFQERFPNSDKRLTFFSSGFKSHVYYNTEGILEQKSVVVSGEILKHIHSLLSYDTENTRLKLKMSSQVSVEYDAYYPRTPPDMKLTMSIIFNSELSPTMDAKGDIIFYTSGQTISSDLETSVKAESPIGIKRGLANSFKTHISSISLWIEGIDFDLRDITPHPDAGHKNIFETGLYSDVTIVTKDGSRIPCHACIIGGQSSVLRGMLNAKKESGVKDAGLILIKDWFKPQVMSFLAFLYYGDLGITLWNTAMAVALIEMVHFYDVKGLEKKVKTVLLSRDPNAFGVNTALRLFKVACGSNDIDLKRKVADVLEIQDDEDIFNSKVYISIGFSTMREELKAMRRVKFASYSAN